MTDKEALASLSPSFGERLGGEVKGRWQRCLSEDER